MRNVKKALIEASIHAFEEAMDARYIGTLFGELYFIDVSGCPFAHKEIMRLDMDEPDCFQTLWLDNVHGQLKQMALKADVVALKAERDALAYREKVAKNKIESLTGYLATALAGEKFKTPKVSVSYRKSETVEVEDVHGIPTQYLIPQPDKVDKTELKKALKAGEFIAGAKIVEHSNIQIR